MIHRCEWCSGPFEARSTAKFCSDACRKRATRARNDGPALSDLGQDLGQPGRVTAATTGAIESLPEPVRGSPLAAVALRLAAAVERAQPRELAMISRELRATLADLQAEATAGGFRGDLVDRLRDDLAARRRLAQS